MAETAEVKLAEKKHVLVDAHVRVEFTRYWNHYETPEKKAERLEESVKDFHDFIRDHRHQDITDLDVVREYEDQCSACDAVWETYEDDDGVYCATCGTGAKPA